MRTSALSPLVALVTGVLLTAGCTPALPPAPALPPNVVAAVPAVPPPPLTAVPDPDGLVFFGRVKNLAAANKVVWDWARLPTVDVSELVKGFLDGAMHDKGSSALAGVVDPSEPMDIAVSFEAKIPPKGLVAGSLAVKSIDAAKSALSALFELVPAEDGVVRLVKRTPTEMSTKKGDADDESPVCELAPGAGKAPYRLICGDSADSLNALGPYLARTATRRDIPADVHFEVRARPVGTYATLGRLEVPKMLTGILGMSPATEPATVDLVNAALGDLFDYVADLDVMSFDGVIDPKEAKLTTRTTFRSATSLIAQLSVGHPERADVPPATLWRLPDDVDFASFAGGVDEADIRHPRDLAALAAREQLHKHKMPDADARALVDAFKATVRPSRGVVAHGAPGDTSYWVFERDETPAVSDKAMRELMAALARPGVGKWLQSTLSSDVKLPTWVAAPPMAGLPKGSTHYAITAFFPTDLSLAASKLAGKKKPVATDMKKATYHFVVMPDGPRSWVGLSSNEALLHSKLASIIAAGAHGPSLADKAAAVGLAGFKESRMSSGGFLTVRALVALARTSLEGKDAAAVARWDSVVAQLPGKGTTAMTFTSAPGAPTADDPGGVSVSEIEVPAEAIRDAVWFAMQADALK